MDNIYIYIYIEREREREKLNYRKFDETKEEHGPEAAKVRV